MRFWDCSGANWTLTRRLVAHTGHITGVRFSPDGSRVATSSDDFTAGIWDAKMNRSISILRGHDMAVKNVAWSPDGSVLATCGIDQAVRLWETSPQDASLASDAGKGFELAGIAWSPDRSLMACVGASHDVLVWDPATGALVDKLAGHTRDVTCVAWSPDGAHIATGSYDHDVRVWHWARRKCVATLSGHKGQVLCLAWDPTHPARLASASSDDDDGLVRLWDTATGECTATLLTRVVHEKAGRWCAVVALAFAPAAAPSSGEGSGRGNSGTGDGDGIGDDGGGGGGGGSALLATCSKDNKTVRLWDVATGECRATLEVFLPAGVAWSPDGRQLAVAANEGVLRWDAAALVAAGGAAPSATTTDADAEADADEGAKAETGAAPAPTKLGSTAAKHVAWSPDGSLMVVLTDREGVVLCDPETGEQRAELHGHTGPVEAVAWAPGAKGKLAVATASEDKTVRVWEQLED
ncbi:hypothetical protein GPECTOR_427g293 [Gonium pectorale]|uniref:Anaphase-promoting complex subunit 4 WD40 domain-containing protein n=1 Tax=Gonium pectorale TaxID=33097 RepID=A0A150FV72_GONPE|nr:hypothetical protein GPECTOR_427g293 [Gonium pectorale]|eukprot:KXZ41499.1 hypothetical protein GPECTOR_427g293 [Gonium pectorale]